MSSEFISKVEWLLFTVAIAAAYALAAWADNGGGI